MSTLTTQPMLDPLPPYYVRLKRERLLINMAPTVATAGFIAYVGLVGSFGPKKEKQLLTGLGLVLSGWLVASAQRRLVDSLRRREAAKDGIVL